MEISLNEDRAFKILDWPQGNITRVCLHEISAGRHQAAALISFGCVIFFFSSHSYFNMCVSQAWITAFRARISTSVGFCHFRFLQQCMERFHKFYLFFFLIELPSSDGAFTSAFNWMISALGTFVSVYCMFLYQINHNYLIWHNIIRIFLWEGSRVDFSKVFMSDHFYFLK